MADSRSPQRAAAAERFTEVMENELQGALAGGYYRPGSFDHLMREGVERAKEAAREEDPSFKGAGMLNQRERVILASKVQRLSEAANQKYIAEVRAGKSPDQGVSGAVVLSQAARRLGLSEKHLRKAGNFGDPGAAEAEARRAVNERSLDAAAMAVGQRGGGGGGNNTIIVAGGNARDISDPKKMHAAKMKQWKQLGFSGTSAGKWDSQGLNPFDLPKRIDASKHGLNRQTIDRFTALGIEVVNTPGITKSPGGYSTRELMSGRAAEGRFEGARGLFRRKRVYSQDASGRISRSDLDPKYTAGGVASGIKDSTFGAVKRGIEQRRDDRERRRLQNPFHRIQRIEEVERSRRLTQLEGAISDEETGSMKRRWLMMQLRITKYAMIHRGWMAFVLIAALLFVPWLGVLTWTGWGLGAMALTLFKFIALVLVNVYNAIAGGLVSLINFVGNFFSGLFESLTNKTLDWLQLSHKVCEGSALQGTQTCQDRVFHYTLTQVDTSFPSWPEISKPSAFDTRTLVEVVLALFGIKYDFFNQVLRIFKGE